MCHMGVHLTLGELGKPGLEPYISTCWRSPKSFYDRWWMSGHSLSHGFLGSCPTKADWVPPPIDLDIKLLLYCLPQNLNQSICKRVILPMIGKVGGQKHITYYIALFSRPIFSLQHLLLCLAGLSLLFCPPLYSLSPDPVLLARKQHILPLPHA